MTARIVLARLTERGCRPSEHRPRMAVCPVCLDLDVSLGIGEWEEGVVRLTCWRGCPEAWVWRALGLRMPESPGAPVLGIPHIEVARL
jgi:hypothetical protein